MAWWTALFSAPKVIETAVDTASTVVKGGMDMFEKAFYTDQEKAQMAKEMQAMWMDLVKVLAGDNSISARARRGIAYIIVATFCTFLFASAGLFFFNKEWSEFVLKIALSTYLAEGFFGVMLFFYGPYMVGKYIKGTPGVLGDVTKVEEKK